MKYVLAGVGILGLIALAYHAGFISFGHTGASGKELDTMRVQDTMNTFTLSSFAFADGRSIPSQYTCDGAQTSPPLSIRGAPQGAQSFALIMEDPDIPRQLNPSGLFVHWVLFNIPAGVTEIIEGGSVGTPGANSFGKKGYASPCPPPQYEPTEHRYVFTLYALDTQLSLSAGATKGEVLKAMTGHILAQTQLIGKYRRR